MGDALADLPEEARERLDAFARALERLHVDDLPLHVARRRQPQHRRAVEAAALVAHELGLEETVAAARRALVEDILRVYANAQFRYTLVGMSGAPGLAEGGLRVIESLGEAVMALVLWERLDDADRGELLGLWERLLP